MPIWNGVEYRERAVEPKSPRFSVNPAGDSRLDMPCWIDWADLTAAADGTHPLAFKALLGYAATMDPVSLNGWVSYSPEYAPVFGFPASSAGLLPLSYAGARDGFWLAESIQTSGDLPQGFSTSRGVANYDEGNCVVGFRCPPNGYRAIPDTFRVSLAGMANPGVPDGDGTALPNLLRPNLYFLNGWCEVEESFASRAQSLPPSGPGGGGLVWADAAFLASPPAPAGTKPAASVASYIPLSHAEYNVKIYPIPLDGLNDALLQKRLMHTNANPFPPTPPPGFPASVMPQKKRGTLVWNQHTKKRIRMGDGNEAWMLTLKLHWYPFGANYFYRWDRPAAEGGPGFARVARADGSSLFPEIDYSGAFLVHGEGF